MSSPPVKFTRSADFSDFQAANPTLPPSGVSLDSEFDNLKTATDKTIDRLAELQRDDGKIANQIVTPDALSPSSRILIAGIGVPRGPWAALAVYAAKDLASFANITYICVTPHPASGAFATDLGAGKWLSLATEVGGSSFIPYFEYFDGTGAAQNITLANNFGTNSLAIQVYTKGDTSGFDLKDPSTYTVSGTTLGGTFPSGVRTVLVFSPSSTLAASLSTASASATTAAAAAVTAAAAAAAAAASDADVISKVTLITSYGAHKGANNFFDIPSSSVVAGIQNRGGVGITGYIDGAMVTALAAGGAWVFPVGEYHFANTMSFPEGFRLIGMSRSSASGTVIFTGGAGGTWAGEMLNANSTSSIQAYSIEDAFFQVTNSGFRWNSASAGFTDDASSQAYMIAPRVINCGFGMDSGTRYQCLQMNKCFDFSVEKSNFTNFTIDTEFNGCDIGVYMLNRSDNAADCCVLATAQSTFGNSLAIRDNDFNNPKNNFIRTSYRDILIEGGKMESDYNTGSSGAGGKMHAAIDISGAQAFKTRIRGISMDVLGYVESVVRLAPNENTYELVIEDITTASNAFTVPLLSLTADMPYFNNSSGRTVCRIAGGNFDRAGVPMNTEEDNAPLPANCLALWTPGRRGINGVTSTYGTVACRNGLLRLPPDAGGASMVEISDFPAPLHGTLTVYMIAEGSVANQRISVNILDNGSSISGGFNDTNLGATANSLTGFTLAAANSVATKLQIQLRNTDTTRNGDVFIKSVSVHWS